MTRIVTIVMRYFLFWFKAGATVLKLFALKAPKTKKISGTPKVSSGIVFPNYSTFDYAGSRVFFL